MSCECFHCERIIKTLEDIRDSSVTRIRINDANDAPSRDVGRDVEVARSIEAHPVT